MDSRNKLYSIFSEALEIEIDEIHDELTYNSIPKWDSISHMNLIAALENAFDVMLDTDDIIDMSSVEKAKNILEKYGVNLN